MSKKCAKMQSRKSGKKEWRAPARFSRAPRTHPRGARPPRQPDSHSTATTTTTTRLLPLMHSAGGERTASKERPTMEGYGGPVNVTRPDYSDIDPTLDACCRREAENNRKQGAVVSALRRHDRVALAERRRRHVLGGLSWGDGCRCCYDPNSDGGEYGALSDLRARLAEEEENGVENEEGEDANERDENDNQEQRRNGQITSEPAFGNGSSKPAGSASDSDSDSDDSEFDYLLDEDIPGESSALAAIEEVRRAELEMTIVEREAALQHGYGAHRQMHPGRVLRAAGLGMTTAQRGNMPMAGGAVAPAVALHLYDPQSEMSANLDLFLESNAMAGTYRGTKFLRGSGRAALLMDTELAQHVLPRLRPEADMPALIAIKDGAVVAHCPALENLGSKTDGTIEPRAVEEFLGRAGVLLRDPPAFEDLCRIRPEEMMLLENMAEERAAAGAAAAEPEPEEFYNCGVKGCNKTFHHEHVGLKTDQQDGLLVSQEDTIGDS